MTTKRPTKLDVAGAGEYDPMKEPRYTEIATFMRAPLARTLVDVDIGLIGVPTDLGVTNRPGARHGPREIRNSSSLMRSFNLALGVNPYELCRIADLGDVRVGLTRGLRTVSLILLSWLLPLMTVIAVALVLCAVFVPCAPGRDLAGWCPSGSTPPTSGGATRQPSAKLSTGSPAMRSRRRGQFI